MGQQADRRGVEQQSPDRAEITVGHLDSEQPLLGLRGELVDDLEQKV
jgi:hypothetical protein